MKCTLHAWSMEECATVIATYTNYNVFRCQQCIVRYQACIKVAVYINGATFSISFYICSILLLIYIYIYIYIYNISCVVKGASGLRQCKGEVRWSQGGEAMASGRWITSVSDPGFWIGI